MSRLLREYEARKEFEAFFDEVTGDVSVGRLRYSASEVLRQVDPVAYREEFSFWCDMMVDSGVYVEGYTDELMEEEEETEE